MKKTVATSVSLIVIVALGVIAFLAVYALNAKREADALRLKQEQTKEVTVHFHVHVPEGTPANQLLYLSGSSPNLGNWDGAGVPLTRGEGGAYHGEVTVLSGIKYGFKVTRGTWSTVEVTKDDKDIEDRNLEVEPNGEAKFDITVAAWRDRGLAVPGRITVTGDVRVHKLFKSELLELDRDLVVYLPPGYDESGARYPVLYMHDGQNLMDESTSYNGNEWEVDETLEKLIASGKIAPVIVVGVYNSPNRSFEFVPKAATADGSGQGELHAEMIATEIKPFIDSRYRTLADRANTGVGGAGLGGIAALHAAITQPETFGQVVVFNPWDWDGERAMLGDLSAAATKLSGTRVVLDVKDLGAALQAAGMTAGGQYLLIDAAPDKNREPDWADRFDEAAVFLYAK